jgi:4-amino-4-deoxy-L-arabinose transferase-like glycosyltransferase
MKSDKQDYKLINTALFLSLIAFIIHLVGNPHYGFFRDELYFIMCGFRPALGYVDQPSLTPLLAASTQYFGESLFLLRALAAVFAACSVYVTCLLVTELGGGSFAQMLAALVAFFCPVLMNFGTKVSPDMFGLVLWPLSVLYILRILNGAHAKTWLLVGILFGISFNAKYSIVFFAIAITLGLIVTKQRRILFTRWAFFGAALCILISLPNILWQWYHHFPMIELLRAGQNGKNIILSPIQFIASQLLITNPVLAICWIVGFIWLLYNSSLRFIAIAYIFIIAQMLLFHGKHYYAANFYPMLIAAGGVAIEFWTKKNNIKNFRPLIIFFGIVFGIVLVPYVMPILPVNTFIRYNSFIAPLLHLKITKTENTQEGLLPQDFADMHGWPELAKVVRSVVDSLPPEDRNHVVIAAQNYGEAAAIEFFWGSSELPPVISSHNQYYLWGPGQGSADLLIDVNGYCGKSIGLYRSAVLAATFHNPLVMPYENNIPIMICRGINRSLKEYWPNVKHYE